MDNKKAILSFLPKINTLWNSMRFKFHKILFKVAVVCEIFVPTRLLCQSLFLLSY